MEEVHDVNVASLGCNVVGPFASHRVVRKDMAFLHQIANEFEVSLSCCRIDWRRRIRIARRVGPLLEELVGKTEFSSVDQVTQKLDLFAHPIVNPPKAIELSVHNDKVSPLGGTVCWDRAINLYSLEIKTHL